MPERIWTIERGNHQYEVKLKHGYWSGRRQIWLDDQLVESSQKFVDTGSRHMVVVDGAPYEIAIRPIRGGAKFAYFLLNDGIPLPSEADRQAGRTSAELIHAAGMDDTAYWLELAQETGLKYYPVSLTWADWTFRHRLYGQIDGCWVAVGLTQGNSQTTPHIYVTVHHAPLRDPTALANYAQQASVDPVLSRLPGTQKLSWPKAKKPDTPTSSIDRPIYHSSFDLPYRPRRESAAVLGQRVLDIAHSVARITGPLAENHCCSCEFDRATRVVFLNGVLMQLCDACIEAIPTEDENARRRYAEYPVNWGRALLWGGGVAMLGMTAIAALGWGLILALLRLFPDADVSKIWGKVIGAGLMLAVALLYIAVVKVMQRASKKSPPIFHSIAAAFLGVGALALRMIDEDSFLAPVGVLGELLLYFAGVMFLYGLTHTWEQRRAAKTWFKSYVEFLPTKRTA